MRFARLLSVAALVAAFIAFYPVDAAAQAPDPKAIEEAKKRFASGNEKYQAGDKAGAVEDFKEAYKLSKNALLLYNIGLVYDELHDRPLAVHYYEKFVSDAPDNEKTAPNRKLASERIPILKKEIADEEAAAAKAAEEAAKAEADAKAKADADAKPKSGVKDFVHEVIEEAPPKMPLDITARIPDDADWILTVYYRPAGEENFKNVKMRPRYQDMVGRIPATAMTGSSVQYYIEVKNKAGNPVAFSGRAASPNIVYIEPGAKPHILEEEMTDDDDDRRRDDDDRRRDDDDDRRFEDPDDGKVVDAGRDWKWWTKWGTTAGTAVFVTLAIVFNETAKNNSAALEADARNSIQGDCPGGPPCRSFSGTQKNYETDGQFYETMTNVSLVVGVGCAGIAGYLWYKDLTKGSRSRTRDRASDDSRRGSIFAAPVVTEDYIGGAAVLHF